jgi:lambda family phage minor tail protein L
MTIQQEIQLQATDAIIELFELDCTQLGGTIYRFSPQLGANNQPITFNNQIWNPLPIMIEGLNYSGSEAPAKPSITLSNVSKVMLPAVINQGDIVGAKLTRWRTFAKYLSTGSQPSGTSFLPRDIWYIERKEHHNKLSIKWMLTSELNKANRKLPRRLFLKRDFPGLANARI